MIAAAYPPLTPSDASRQLPRRGSLIPLWQSAAPVQAPVHRLSSPVNHRGIQWGPQPRPYSPEFGAAPIGRCWKIPAKRPSQIETICFDLKRRSHRAIRSFRSITVLRKRSERRALRRGSLWRFLSPLSLAAKKAARRRRRDRGTKRRDKGRIRREPEDCPLRRDGSLDEGCFAPAGATFFRSAAKAGKDAPGEPFHKGSPGPLLTAKGLRPIGSPARVYGGRKTKDGAPLIHRFAVPLPPGEGNRCGGAGFLRTH